MLNTLAVLKPLTSSCGSNLGMLCVDQSPTSGALTEFFSLGPLKGLPPTPKGSHKATSEGPITVGARAKAGGGFEAFGGTNGAGMNCFGRGVGLSRTQIFQQSLTGECSLNQLFNIIFG